MIMRKSSIITLAALIISLLLISSSSAQDTLLISYQGRLTDDGGNPVSGTQAMTFTIYDGAGASKWTESHATVQVNDGLFSVILGSQTALPDSVFAGDDRYLGITVGGDPEIYPRILLTSAPMAARALSSDLAGNSANLGGQGPSYYLDWNNLTNIPAGFDDDIDDAGISAATGDSNYVNVTGDTMSGELTIQYDGSTRGRIYGDEARGCLELYHNGELHLYDNSASTIMMGAGNNSDPYLVLIDYAGSESMAFNTGSTAQYSVNLPARSIDNIEILDEPGISRTIDTTTGEFPVAGLIDIVTTSITIPSPGYIFLIANCYVQIYPNGTMTDLIELQIDEEVNGPLEPPHFIRVGYTYSVFSRHVPASVTRTYYKTEAGSYTFRLEGRRTNAYGGLTVENPAITAIYFPTSYGTVNTISENTLHLDNATPINLTDEDGNNVTGYEVDLRDLELRVKEAQLRAKEAELELFKARHQPDQRSR